MAVPKVFISSTCYDLFQIRDTLFEFIKSYYYEPVLSEKGDVFFHPDLHTHESCIHEISNCQLFILIIGGRFGGKYKFDKSKSITNAEYEAARLKNIPVLTFIKREVYEDHRIYQNNKHDIELTKKINFPSIERQEYAVNIFQFIDRVRLGDENNGFFPFEYAKEIKDNLGKQWAGLMFDFLTKRIKYKDDRIVSKTLDNLTLINRKTEEIVESIYKKINPQEADKKIDTTDRIIEGSKFLSRVFDLFHVKKLKSSIEEVAKINPKNLTWFEFLRDTGEFELMDDDEAGIDWDTKEEVDMREVVLWLKYKFEPVYWGVVVKKGELHSEIKKLIDLFEKYKELNKAERMKSIEITTANTV
ncbi:DUF4062 domain-containing protein [Aequorivita nionensis]|uniref:DUF4062 domain-containing protein n=1 Tax=Aequorivita nionensis TaxID=1287690 RepID=UPI0039659782